jgi:hypothetical protein
MNGETHESTWGTIIGVVVILAILGIIVWGIHHDGVLQGRCDAGDHRACDELEAGYELARGNDSRP